MPIDNVSSYTSHYGILLFIVSLKISERFFQKACEPLVVPEMITW